MVLLIILGLLDLIVGLGLVLPIFSNAFIFYLGIFTAFKGLFSLVSSFAQGFYFEWIGASDLIAGIMFIFGFRIPWFWLIPFLKGVYSIAIGVITGLFKS